VWGRDHAGMMMIVVVDVVDVVVAAAAIVHHHRASTKEMMASRGVTRIIESSCMSSLCRSIRDDCFGYLLYLAGLVIRNLPIDWLTTNIRRCGEKISCRLSLGGFRLILIVRLTTLHYSSRRL